jgi:tetratricopeptide (TPR) repeat protein
MPKPKPILVSLRAFASATLAPLLAFSLAFGAAPAPLSAGQHPWVEVKSPHFRVLTDGSVGDARHLALQFEQMRAVFGVGFPKMRLDTGAILTILAPSNEYSLHDLAPAFWKKEASKFAGIFQDGWERKYAIVRLDQNRPGAQFTAVYHEYTHTLLHANFQWLPIWLDEGLAEFYGNSRFEGSKTYVGAPSVHVQLLRQKTLIKLDELISENPWVKFHNDQDGRDLFYAESWALVHYLMMSPEMGRGEKLNQFYKALLNREPRQKAFQDAFGNFDVVEKGLQAYVGKFLFASYVMENPPQINEKDFASRTMSVAETEAEIGTYRFWSRDHSEARQSIEQALRDDPNQPLAHETLGFLDYADGKDKEAAADFTKAVELDPNRFLSRFYKATLAFYSVSNPTPDDAKALRSAMYSVQNSNGAFAPADVQLSLAMARAGDLNGAFIMAQRAEELEPHRAGYHLLVARIQIAANYAPKALKEVSFVADRWRGPDRDEALEIWHKIPGATPPPEQIEVNLNLTGTSLKDPNLLLNAIPKTATGTVTSIECGDKHKLVVQTSDGPQTFVTSGGSVPIGYSDTFWWAGDHFSPCHHIAGIRAVVRYKSNTAKGDSLGDWTELELRDDLPTPPSTAANPTPASVPASVAPANPTSAKPAESNPTPPPSSPKQ